MKAKKEPLEYVFDSLLSGRREEDNVANPR